MTRSRRRYGCAGRGGCCRGSGRRSCAGSCGPLPRDGSPIRQRSPPVPICRPPPIIARDPLRVSARPRPSPTGRPASCSTQRHARVDLPVSASRSGDRPGAGLLPVQAVAIDDRPCLREVRQIHQDAAVVPRQLADHLVERDPRGRPGAVGVQQQYRLARADIRGSARSSWPAETALPVPSSEFEAIRRR